MSLRTLTSVLAALVDWYALNIEFSDVKPSRAVNFNYWLLFMCSAVILMLYCFFDFFWNLSLIFNKCHRIILRRDNPVMFKYYVHKFVALFLFCLRIIPPRFDLLSWNFCYVFLLAQERYSDFNQSSSLLWEGF